MNSVMSKMAELLQTKNSCTLSLVFILTIVVVV